MSPTNHRHERVGEEIAHEINAMLAGELKDPRLEGMVVVSEVRVQPDMKHARVFVSMRGSSKEQTDAIKALEHAAGYIRSEIIERLQLRRLPELHFTLDLSQEHVERIEQLLRDMKKDKPSSNP
ncbi:MAG TPA: 30S ribosome-binding factor RbfA [Candidatus Acidoferrum sp.]